MTRPIDVEVQTPAGPANIIIENGEGHFFFASPIGHGGENGEFNPNLATDVRICEWDRSAAGDSNDSTDPCVSVLDSFETSEIAIGNGLYHVNWKLKDTDGLALGELYGIQVLASGVPLGSAEVVVGRNGKQARDFSDDLGGGVIPLNKNQTLPIKYRIEYGIFCEGDCVEIAVNNNEGGTVTSQGEDVGVTFAPETFPDELEDVTVIIEEIDAGPGECLGDLGVLITSGRCIHFDTQPQVDSLREPAVVGICPDDGDVPPGVDPEHFKIHHFDPDNAGEGVEELPGAAAPFLDCSGFDIAQLDRGPISRLAHAGFQAIKRLVGPAPLAARDEGFGGVTSRFSYFQWALPIEIVAVSPTSFTGVAGSTLTDSVTIQVLTAHNHGGAPQVPVPNQSVSFEFFDVGGSSSGAAFGEVADGPGQLAGFVAVGGGSLGTVTVQTDANGFATLPWTLTNNIGIQTLEVTGFNTGTLVFTAQALQPAWSGSGGNDFTVLNDGTSGDPSMWYDWNTNQGDTYSERLWYFSTTAAADGVVTLPYTYDVLHSWYQVNIDLWAFVTHGGSTTYTQLVDLYNEQYTGNQYFTGIVQLNVAAGDEYGFRFGGDNYDSANILQGTLTVVGPTFQPAGS